MVKLGFLGDTHLGQTLSRAAEFHGFDTTFNDIERSNVVFVAPDVDDHTQLSVVDECMAWAVKHLYDKPIVLVSQVPPGYTRPWRSLLPHLYYQVDTIIMNCALHRATNPERFVVGKSDKRERIAPHYMAYLKAHHCPIVEMDYESAELSKLAINYYLAEQVLTTNKLAAVAKCVGATWDDMIPGLRLDARIGKSYIQPGEVGGHLPRDVKTIDKLLGRT